MGGPAYINGKTYKELDNFYQCKFKADGLIWTSSEQFFQYQKNEDDNKYRKMINEETNPYKAYQLGNSCKLRKDWELFKVEAMKVANTLKFSQNPDLKDILINTDGKILFRASTPFWNEWNGKILEYLRAYFRLEEYKAKSN